MSKQHTLSIWAFLFLGLLRASTAWAQDPAADATVAVDAWLATEQAKATKGLEYNAFITPGTKSTAYSVESDRVIVTFNEQLVHRTRTIADAEQLESGLREVLGDRIAPQTPLEIRVQYGNSKSYNLKDLVTDQETIRRLQWSPDKEFKPLGHPVVEHSDYAGPARTRGLGGRNLVVAASHGWTWHTDNRWQYQRARLYTIVEDLYPQSYINPFLIPMLENAGADVFSLRERDYQVGEAIVDNDGVDDGSRFVQTGTWSAGTRPGWKGGRHPAITLGQEPFKEGTSLIATKASASTALYVPLIPHAGRYAVYLSWPSMGESMSASVPYQIRHLGGTTTVRVNQQVAGGTWLFAGMYWFSQGASEATGSILVETANALPSSAGEETLVGIDAVRFGGGMGNVAPGNSISGKPRYAEGALYYARYAGAPEDSVLLLGSDPGHFGVDYNRDISARGAMANWLASLGVPIDAMISWHTDAGTSDDSLIGTLSVYRLIGEGNSDTFPDGRSRLLNRQLAALVQDEIVKTAQANYSTGWVRRQLRDTNFGETRRPNMPSMLLELLSHQNFNDMQYGLDPRFKFDIARAIYKGMLRFVAMSNGYEPIVTPLAPTHVSARHLGGGKVRITWQLREDPIEPTATPAGFIVYRSADGRAFDNGTFTSAPSMEFDGAESGKAQYYRVTAVNDGGESLPTPVVGVRWSEGSLPILIVDGFDRLSGPAIVKKDGAVGFNRHEDAGVGYEATYGLVGDMYDFGPAAVSPWANDLEAPGAGSSQSMWETRLELGNSFDHVAEHGDLLALAGRAFDSCTHDAYAAGLENEDYDCIDWIAGEQKTTMPPAGITGPGAPDRMQPAFEVIPAYARERLEKHVKAGRALIISGAHIGADLTTGPLANDSSRAFANGVLGIYEVAGHSTEINTVRPAKDAAGMDALKSFWFGRDLEAPINIVRRVYPVESAESFPVAEGSGANALLEYADTGHVAAIVRGRVAVVGFPIETVLPEAARKEFMNTLLARTQRQQGG